MATIPRRAPSMEGFQVNRPPVTFEPAHDLPEGFLDFLTPLHHRFAPLQRALIEERRQILAEAAAGREADAPVSRETPSGADGGLNCRNGARTSATR